MSRIHLVSNLAGAGALGEHLRGAGLGPTSARAADALLVLIDRPLDAHEQDLLDRARQSVPVLLAGPTLSALPADSPLAEATGLVPSRTIPAHELRIGPGLHGQEVATRLDPDARFVDSWIYVDKIADDVQQLLMVRHEMAEQPLCTWRPSTGLGVLTIGSAEETLVDPAFHRLVGRWLRHTLDIHDEAPVRVGVLGTTDSAARHATAAGSTPGLDLGAVVEGPGGPSITGPEAGAWVRRYATPAELVGDPDLGLVVVCTRANTRAEWAMRAMEAGKHVVIDSPHCLSTHDAAELATLASARGLTVATYPSHTDAPTYRALTAAVTRGNVGTLFSVDVNACSYRRPDATWHDDARLSGGQLFDRAAAPMGWLLDLLPQAVDWVSATSHKRVWHDVTNADHTRVFVRFADGVEATVTLSDVVASPRPAFELVGTDGTLVATADGAITVYRGDGAQIRRPAPGPADPGAFHRALADHLVSGWPLPLAETAARRVVSVLEAAARSAAVGGTLTTPE